MYFFILSSSTLLSPLFGLDWGFLIDYDQQKDKYEKKLGGKLNSVCKWRSN